MALPDCPAVGDEVIQTASRGMRPRVYAVALFLLYFAVVTGLQWAGGAYRADIGGQSDDSAHYITGLMVRDYVAAPAPFPPMDFAKNYYLHYPRIALGQWPPGFYIFEAVWMLLFSPSTLSVMLMMALCTTLLALTTYRLVADEFGHGLGAATGLLLTCLPLVQELTSAVMLDIPVALLCCWAVMLFMRYLTSGKWTGSAGFGILASLAILTHGVAIFLVVVPPIVVALERRVRLLERFSFWLPAMLVIALCGPWYLLTPGAQHELVVKTAGLRFAPNQTGYASLTLLRIIGVALFTLVVVGLVDRVLLPFLRGRKPGARWSCAAAMVIGFYLLRILVAPATPGRHLVVILPTVILFAAAGLVRLASWLPVAGLSLQKRQWALASIVGIVFGHQVFAVPKLVPRGFSQIARELVNNPEFKDSVFLVSAEGFEREGQFIAGVAMQERRPGHFVLRASKVLASVSILGRRYVMLHRTPDELMSYLKSVPVGVLVMDNCASPQKWEHQSLLRRTLDQHAAEWELVGSHACPQGRGRDANRVMVYSLRGHQSMGRPKVRIDMRNRLNEVLVNGQEP